MKEFLTELRDTEKEVFSDIKNREDNIRGMMERLDAAKAEAKVEKTIYDIAAEQSEFQAAEDATEKSDQKDDEPDYLTPFLAKHAGGVTSEKEAALVKEACLFSLKERLLERAVIIQAHLDQEQQKLQSRQTVFKRSAVGQGGEEEEKFTKFHDEAVFRIDILRDRLARHERQAIQRYYEMDTKLSTDARLHDFPKKPNAGNQISSVREE